MDMEYREALAFHHYATCRELFVWRFEYACGAIWGMSFWRSFVRRILHHKGPIY